MNDSKRDMMLLKVLHQIQQDNKDSIKKVEKSFTATCKEEGISFEQVLLCFFDGVFITNISFLW